MNRFGLLLVIGLWTGSAHAQLNQVLDLNRQGMDAYTNLELEQAMDLLQQALAAAQRSGVSGSQLARTYINLGVVAVGGFQDTPQGLQHFMDALRTDPTVQLDPLTSTPDIQAVWTLAQNRMREGGSTGVVETAPPDLPPEQPAGGPGIIPHRPVSEQLAQTAVPIFVEAPEDAAVGDVYVYYKAPGMRDFRRALMRRMAGGFGLELPCGEIHAPGVQYYIVAFGEDNASPIGVAGSPERPFVVNVVSERTLPPPALPGSVPPEQCMEEECPPGMPGCSSEGGSAGLGDTCRSTSECRSGLVCEDEFCIVGDSDSGDGDDDDEGGDDWPRVFVDLGFSLGFGYAASNRPADSAPQPPEDDPRWQAYQFQPDFPECTAQPSEYCVRLEQPGFLPAPALRFTAGVFVISRLAIAATLRYQLNAGQGTFSHILLGLRLLYQLSKPAADGLFGNVHLGSSYGQIQLQPPQNGADEPYIISGLNGIQLGGSIGYRFVKNFGIVFTPEVHLLLPTFMFVLDFTFGVQVAF